MNTPSAGGVVIHDDKVLVITSAFHKSTDLPKGTVENGSSLNVTAIREVKEETGYDTRIVSDLGSITYDFDSPKGKRYRKTVSYFLMELVNDDQPQQQLQEGEDFITKWLSFDEAMAQLTFPEAQTVVRTAFENLPR